MLIEPKKTKPHWLTIFSCLTLSLCLIANSWSSWRVTEEVNKMTMYWIQAQIAVLEMHKDCLPKKPRLEI